MNQTIKTLIYCVLSVFIIFSIDTIISLSFSLKEKQHQTEIKKVDCSCSETNCKTHTSGGDWIPTDQKCFTSDKNCFYCCLGKSELIK